MRHKAFQPIIGVGFGLINLPAVVVVSTYFEEKRAFAQGIAQAGAGIGTLLMAPTVNLLDDKLGWANTLVVIGALVLLCVPLAVLFRPLAADDSGQVRGRTGSYDINIPKGKTGHVPKKPNSGKQIPKNVYGTYRLHKIF